MLHLFGGEERRRGGTAVKERPAPLVEPQTTPSTPSIERRGSRLPWIFTVVFALIAVAAIGVAVALAQGGTDTGTAPTGNTGVPAGANGSREPSIGVDSPSTLAFDRQSNPDAVVALLKKEPGFNLTGGEVVAWYYLTSFSNKGITGDRRALDVLTRDFSTGPRGSWLFEALGERPTGAYPGLLGVTVESVGDEWYRTTLYFFDGTVVQNQTKVTEWGLIAAEKKPKILAMPRVR